jgi:hypothetical protein
MTFDYSMVDMKNALWSLDARTWSALPKACREVDAFE